MMELHNIMEFHNMMEFHHIMEFHHMMEFHHIMDIHNFIWFVKSLAVLTTYWYKMSLVKPLFVASIASPTLMMTSMSSTINLLQQMGILPTLGTCSNYSSPTGAYKSEGLFPLLQLQEEAVTAPEHLPQQQQRHLLLMYQFCNSHRTYNTVAKETFLPQQLKKWKCTTIKLFDIIKVANDFCKSFNFWKNKNVQKSVSISCLTFLFQSYDK